MLVVCLRALARSVNDRTGLPLVGSHARSREERFPCAPPASPTPFFHEEVPRAEALSSEHHRAAGLLPAEEGARRPRRVRRCAEGPARPGGAGAPLRGADPPAALPRRGGAARPPPPRRTCAARAASTWSRSGCSTPPGESDQRAQLTAFADLLERHVRWEERDLFPYAELHVDEAALATIGGELIAPRARAERVGARAPLSAERGTPDTQAHEAGAEAGYRSDARRGVLSCRRRSEDARRRPGIVRRVTRLPRRRRTGRRPRCDLAGVHAARALRHLREQFVSRRRAALHEAERVHARHDERLEVRRLEAAPLSRATASETASSARAPAALLALGERGGELLLEEGVHLLEDGA